MQCTDFSISWIMRPFNLPLEWIRNWPHISRDWIDEGKAYAPDRMFATATLASKRTYEGRQLSSSIRRRFLFGCISSSLACPARFKIIPSRLLPSMYHELVRRRNFWWRSGLITFFRVSRMNIGHSTGESDTIPYADKSTWTSVFSSLECLPYFLYFIRINSPFKCYLCLTRLCSARGVGGDWTTHILAPVMLKRSHGLALK